MTTSGGIGGLPPSPPANLNCCAKDCPLTVGLEADLPPAANAEEGQQYFATDTGTLWIFDGVAWVAVGAGGAPQGTLLDYAQTIFQTQVNVNVYTDIFDMDITFDGDGLTDTLIEFHAGALSVIAGAANPTTLRLWDDTLAAAITHSYFNNPAATAQIQSASMRAIIDPFVGTKTVKAQMKRQGAGTTTINGDGDQPRLMNLAAYRLVDAA